MFEHAATWLARQMGRPSVFFGVLGIVFLFHVAIAFPALREPVLLWFGAETGNLGVLTTLLLLGGQRREALATQAKLDEAIYANEAARNELIGVEGRTAAEIAALRRRPI